MKLFYFLSLILFSAQAFAQQPYLGPALPSDLVNWTKYCIQGKTAPAPNMADPEVQAAYAKLRAVSPASYYFYSGPLRAYKLAKPTGTTVAETGDKNATLFLSLLCGEFRDRPTMIREKLRWAANLYKLPVGAQPPIDPTKPLWPQVYASSYRPYLNFSDALWQAEYLKVYSTKYKFGADSVDQPVDGQLICKTKHIFVNYVAKGLTFNQVGLQKFEEDYKTFAANHCRGEDLTHYYDFRGDSNFKPNSPESNGMIWYSSSLTAQCEFTNKAKINQTVITDPTKKVTDLDCQNYFKKPFLSRWNAARAGLATWLLRDTAYDLYFNSQYQSITILPHKNSHLMPFGYRFSTEPLMKLLTTWNPALWPTADIGFNSVTGLGSGDLSKINYGFTYQRLRDAVNRHTNWYHSGFDDGMGMVRTEAYSPFVASSYEMSKSDGFTAPGVTVKSPTDGRKHWMFVFKVKKENWYNTASLNSGVPLDFDKHWLDETSFGTDTLAKAERAWDRLGSPLEGEYDSILYLHNITTTGEVLPDDGVVAPPK